MKIKMKRNTMMWSIIGVLFVSVIFLTFQAGASSGTVIQAASQAAPVASQSASAAGGMVGGC